MTREQERQLAADTIELVNAEAKRTGLNASAIIKTKAGAQDKRLRDARCRVAQGLNSKGWKLWQIARALSVGVDTARLYVRGERAAV